MLSESSKASRQFISLVNHSVYVHSLMPTLLSVLESDCPSKFQVLGGHIILNPVSRPWRAGRKVGMDCGMTDQVRFFSSFPAKGEFVPQEKGWLAGREFGRSWSSAWGSRFHFPALPSRAEKQDGQPCCLTQKCSVSFYNLFTLLALGRKGIIQRGIV